MGLLAWLLGDDPAQDVPPGWELRTLRVSDIAPSHSVEAGRRTPARYLSTPIWVRPRLLGGYRIHDGNRRLRDARDRGDRTIRAYVKIK